MNDDSPLAIDQTTIKIIGLIRRQFCGATLHVIPHGDLDVDGDDDFVASYFIDSPINWGLHQQSSFEAVLLCISDDRSWQPTDLKKQNFII